MSPGCSGRGKILRFERAHADKAGVGPVCAHPGQRSRHLLRRERGQAMVEFALIAPLFLMIVVGIIQFGIALNYWLDLQRLANQGARYAVVNNWPTCARGSTTCNNATAPQQTLQAYLKDEAVSSGLEDSVSTYVCYPDDGDSSTDPEAIGTPLKLRVQAPFVFMSIVRVPQITLHADVTMRLEQEPTLITGELDPCW